MAERVAAVGTTVGQTVVQGVETARAALCTERPIAKMSEADRQEIIKEQVDDRQTEWSHREKALHDKQVAMYCAGKSLDPTLPTKERVRGAGQAVYMAGSSAYESVVAAVTAPSGSGVIEAEKATEKTMEDMQKNRATVSQ